MSDQSEVETLRREIDELKAKLSTAGHIKVSAKGGVSVYGLGRFPVTLYKDQWLRLLDMANDIRDFIREHLNELSHKDDSKSGGV